jgi:hypothetical protein
LLFVFVLISHIRLRYSALRLVSMATLYMLIQVFGRALCRGNRYSEIPQFPFKTKLATTSSLHIPSIQFHSHATSLNVSGPDATQKTSRNKPCKPHSTQHHSRLGSTEIGILPSLNSLLEPSSLHGTCPTAQILIKEEIN